MTLLDRLKDLWTTLPGLAAIVFAVSQYVTNYSATNAWPPTGMQLFLFFSGILNVISTVTHPKTA